jgi:hypothetical protein
MRLHFAASIAAVGGDETRQELEPMTAMMREANSARRFDATRRIIVASGTAWRGETEHHLTGGFVLPRYYL